MTTPSELSPNLRPVRYCPNCGQRVAQRAETCFMCGTDLHTSERQRLSFPGRELLLIVVVLGVAYLWWTRSGAAEQSSPRVTPAATIEAVVQPGEDPAELLELSPAPPTATAAPVAAITATLPLSVTAAPAEPTIYAVVAGDTVEAIAARYGISAQSLMTANGMGDDLLQVGQRLTIPTAGEAQAQPAATDSAPTETPTPIIYTVISGDTVNKIATRYSVSVSDLMAVNGMSNDLLQVNQKLTIPAGPVARGDDGKLVPTPTATPKNAIYLVVVRTGDTIETIAKRLGSSIEAIVKFNENINSADSIIRPGEQLIVPVGTITATLTIQSDAGPLLTAVPLPTATPGPPHPAPQALTPLDGAALNGDSVLLQWLSVGTLNASEVYVVKIVPEGRMRDELTATTTGTSYRIPSDWLARQGQRTTRFSWSVQVARMVRTSAGGAGSLLATSSPSRYRTFRWQAPAN